MILKINSHLGWFVQDKIKNISYKASHLSQYDCKPTFDRYFFVNHVWQVDLNDQSNNKVVQNPVQVTNAQISDNVVALYIQLEDNSEIRWLADDIVYLLNDLGSTIERIN